MSQLIKQFDMTLQNQGMGFVYLPETVPILTGYCVITRFSDWVPTEERPSFNISFGFKTGNTTYQVARHDDYAEYGNKDLKLIAASDYDQFALYCERLTSYVKILVSIYDSEPKELESISATYTGGAVEAGTPVDDLTGVTVTAHYSDETSEVVTGYTISGTIGIGTNTLTITYQDKTTTIEVVGTEPVLEVKSIYAVYTGGAATVGTSFSALTGITVTAIYEDDSELEVNDYGISAGTIAVGNNTVTLSYSQKTTTIIVTGMYATAPAEYTLHRFNYGDELKAVPLNEMDVQIKSNADQIKLLKGRTFSILGDSYSTFTGFTYPTNNAQYYPNVNVDVTSVREMWWHLFANATKSALIRNCSYSGSEVAKYGGKASYSFVSRLPDLANSELFIIEGGTNDSWDGVPMGDYVYSDFTDETSATYRGALAYILNYLQEHYPGAEIVFMLNNGLSSNINSSTETICDHYNVGLLALDSINKQSNHPSVLGMQQISEQLIAFLA